MSRYQSSKSGLFLLELLINLLLFCILCGCGLIFFSKSNTLSNNAAALQHAVRITSSIAALYESGDGNFTTICEAFPTASAESNRSILYLDKQYVPCSAEDFAYYVEAVSVPTALPTICITFYDKNDTVYYTIRACCYIPSAPDVIKKEEISP